jgi:hypothetical protein
MTGGPSVDDYRVASQVQRPAVPATGLTVRLPTDPDGKDIAAALHSYTFELHTKTVRHGEHSYTYYDFAKATRR